MSSVLEYFFVLGRNPALSAAEIAAVLPEARFVAFSRQILIVDAAKPLPPNFIKRLGGVIKMGFIKRKTIHKSELASVCEEVIQKRIAGTKRIFGLSLYLREESAGYFAKRELVGLGIQIKRGLQDKEHSVRFVSSSENALSSVAVSKNHLLDRGVEFVLLAGRQDFYLGITLAVQEFEEASARDYGRPAREIKVGMVPIQLAKILVNLAGQPLTATLLDPFCGFGTILAEAALMGYQSFIGSDINPQALEATKTNLNWLYTKYKIQDAKYKIFQCDAKNLSARLPPKSVDAIVTEPYLGPIQIQNLSVGRHGEKFKMQNVMNDLTEIYVRAFKEFRRILRPGGRVVFVFPIFTIDQKTQTIVSESALPAIERLGFLRRPLISKELESYSVISPNPRGSIIYSRPNQRVLREIFVFELLERFK